MRRPGENGCGRLLIHAQGLEDVVAEAVTQVVDGPVLAQALKRSSDNDDDDGAERAEVEIAERMAELADMFAAGEIGRAEWMRARRTLERRQKVAQAVLARHRTTTVLDGYAGKPGVLRRGWPRLSLDQRRAIVAAVVERVEIAPATRRGPGFDERRVSFVWRA
jgi:predicted nucleic acid-binding protein